MYHSGSKGQQRNTQKSLVTSTFEIPQWNFNLLIFIQFQPISVVISLFVILVFEINHTLTGVVQKLGSVKVYSYIIHSLVCLVSIVPIKFSIRVWDLFCTFVAQLFCFILFDFPFCGFSVNFFFVFIQSIIFHK